jgi:hypothetical protein
MDAQLISRIKKELIYIILVVGGYTLFIYILFYFLGEPFRAKDLLTAIPVVLLVAYIFKTIFWIVGSIRH